MGEQLQLVSGGAKVRVFAQEVASAKAPSSNRRPAILLLHGSGGHVESWTGKLGPFLIEAGINLYAPHYFDRTGATRADLAMLTGGIHVPQWIDTVNDTLRFVASRPGVDPERVVVAGISLGAFLALALAATLSASDSPAERRRIRALLDVSGGLVPPYDAAATAAMPPTLILHGEADNIVPVSFAHELHQKLTALQVPHRTEILQGEGHWFSTHALPRMLLAVSSFLEQYLPLHQPAS